MRALHALKNVTALQKITALSALMLTTALPVLAQSELQVETPPTREPLPNSGTYFIVNNATEEALEPGQASVGQNVGLRAFTRAGLQKWTIDRKIDPKTKQPTNRYTIRLAGETQGLNFQPHPVADMSAIISMDTSVMVMSSDDSGIMIKSVAKNGDALSSYSSPPSYTETRFGPSDGSARFHWRFVPAN